MNVTEIEKEELKTYGFPEKILSVLNNLIDVNNYEEHVRARQLLVKKGERILPVMSRLMKSDQKNIRKEAIKVVELIADDSSIPEMINMLEDRESYIRWIAAKALIRIGRKSITPLLKALLADSKSFYLRRGVHHVLSELINKKDSVELKKLVHLLRPGIETPEKIHVHVAKALDEGIP